MAALSLASSAAKPAASKIQMFADWAKPVKPSATRWISRIVICLDSETSTCRYTLAIPKHEQAKALKPLRFTNQTTGTACDAINVPIERVKKMTILATKCETPLKQDYKAQEESPIALDQLQPFESTFDVAIVKREVLEAGSAYRLGLICDDRLGVTAELIKDNLFADTSYLPNLLPPAKDERKVDGAAPKKPRTDSDLLVTRIALALAPKATLHLLEFRQRSDKDLLKAEATRDPLQDSAIQNAVAKLSPERVKEIMEQVKKLEDADRLGNHEAINKLCIRAVGKEICKEYLSHMLKNTHKDPNSLSQRVLAAIEIRATNFMNGYDLT